MLQKTRRKFYFEMCSRRMNVYMHERIISTNLQWLFDVLVDSESSKVSLSLSVYLSIYISIDSDRVPINTAIPMFQAGPGVNWISERANTSPVNERVVQRRKVGAGCSGFASIWGQPIRRWQSRARRNSIYRYGPCRGVDRLHRNSLGAPVIGL